MRCLKKAVSVVVLTALLFSGAGQVEAKSRILLEQAKAMYDKGDTDGALEMLLLYVKQNPDDEETHYMLGLALKKLGQDSNSVSELQTALKLAPPGVAHELAQKALSDGTAKPWFGIQFPDVGASFRHAFVQTKKAMKQQQRQRHPSRDYTNDTGAVIPLDDMLALAEDSKAKNPSWQSEPGGVAEFEQAPENSTQWDHWIGRFQKNFDGRLFRHVATEAADDKAGMVAVIFSVDKAGNLKGCIYKSTGSDALNKCVLETIRDLDHSYLLAFPSSTGITGWNFRMDWTFDRALSVIRKSKEAALAAEKAKMDHAQAEKEASAAVTSVDAKIKQKKSEEAQKAAAKRLALGQNQTKVSAVVKPAPKKNVPTRLAAANGESSIVRKAEVSGVVMRPVELKATQLKLSDISDLHMSNGRDVSTLFH